MTVQIGDKYTYLGREYRLLNRENFKPLDPRDLGLKPKAANTACMSGYWCEYKITPDGVFLDNLYVHCDGDDYPTINGVTYDADSEGRPVECMGCRVYRNLNISLMGNGKILVGAEPIASPKTHDAYLPYGYKIVKELMFRDGKLIHEVNWSSTMDEIRNNRNDKEKMSEYKKEYWWFTD